MGATHILCCSTHKCIFLTNVTPFKGNKQAFQQAKIYWRGASLQLTQHQIPFVFTLEKSEKVCKPFQCEKRYAAEISAVPVQSVQSEQDGCFTRVIFAATFGLIWTYTVGIADMFCENKILFFSVYFSLQHLKDSSAGFKTSQWKIIYLISTQLSEYCFFSTLTF